MIEKNIKTRIVHKHAIEADWNKAINFIPKQGELIVYDIDDNYLYERLKIGDGVTVVSELPFIDDKPASDSIIIHSSTPNSKKKFKITIDDNGTIASEEVL